MRTLEIFESSLLKLNIERLQGKATFWFFYFCLTVFMPSFASENAWTFPQDVTASPANHHEPNFLLINYLQIIVKIWTSSIKFKSYFLYFKQYGMTMSSYLWCSHSMNTRKVLQIITWKENTNQKVSDWGYCAEFWMNVGTVWSQKNNVHVKIVNFLTCVCECMNEPDMHEFHAKCVILGKPAKGARNGICKGLLTW